MTGCSCSVTFTRLEVKVTEVNVTGGECDSKCLQEPTCCHGDARQVIDGVVVWESGREAVVMVMQGSLQWNFLCLFMFLRAPRTPAV